MPYFLVFLTRFSFRDAVARKSPRCLELEKGQHNRRSHELYEYIISVPLAASVRHAARHALAGL